MSKLNALLDHASETARVFFKAQGGELHAMWIIETRTGDRLVVATPFFGSKSKDAVATALRQLMAEKDAVRYAFMTEMWFVEPGANVSREDALKILPSESPDREEAVMITAEDVSEGFATRVYPIIRVGDSATLGEPKEEVANQFEGRFMGLLPKPAGAVQ